MSSAIASLLRFDALRMRRDRFLLSTCAYILSITIALRWFLPWLIDELHTRLAFDFTPYVPLLWSHLVLQVTGQLGGIVMGMLLLESREDRMLKALLATPVPLERYVLALGACVMAGTIAIALLEAVVIGWTTTGWLALTAAVLVSAPGAAIFGLLVASIADDKMQALAYLKLLGLLPMAASVAWFVPPPWQWLFAVYPPFFASKLYWLASAGEDGWLAVALLGIAGSLVWLAGLSKLFLRAARR